MAWADEIVHIRSAHRKRDQYHDKVGVNRTDRSRPSRGFTMLNSRSAVLRADNRVQICVE
jgi:hypothetical protein